MRMDGSPHYFAQSGKLWRRDELFPDGCYLDTEVGQRLLALYEAEPWSEHLATELREALKELQHA